MTRPPSPPGLAQLIPDSLKPRAEAEDRADKVLLKSKHIVIASSRENAPAADSSTNGVDRVTRGVASLDAPHCRSQARPDTNDSPPGDVHSTVDSTSSHTSAASSVFSARNAATSSRLPTASATPVATKDSPASFITTTHPTHDLSSSGLNNDRAASSTSHNTLPLSQHDFISSPHPTTERVHARQIGSSVKGVKAQPDTLNDRLHNKGAPKGSRSIYKEFGLVCTIIKLRPNGRGGVSSMRTRG